jgi:predicted kinase
VGTGTPAAAPGHCVVLCGLPGSGKTTYAQQLVGERAAVRLCSDEWMASLGLDLFDEPARARVDALQQSFALELVARGLTVVYESGGWTRAEREVLRARVRQIGGTIELIALDIPTDVLWSRLVERNAEGRWATGRIEHEDLLRWQAVFEHPDAAEQAGYDAPAGPAG